MNSIDLAYSIRLNAVKMVNHAKASHIGGVLSSADIIAVLYSCIANLNPQNPKDPNRDRIILSKGHNGAGIYVALAELGFFDKQLLKTYGDNGSMFSCHVSHKNVPGIELSTGSLGQGVCVACGMAIDAKRKSKKHKVYAIVGDGECNEGCVWETIMLASQQHLDNFTIVVDRNYQQAMGKTKDIIDMEPFADKWKMFGWKVIELENGHNHKDLIEAFNAPFDGCPKVIIAKTVKGKGVSFFEDNIQWHYRDPQGVDFDNAIREIEAGYAQSRS